MTKEPNDYAALINFKVNEINKFLEAEKVVKLESLAKAEDKAHAT